jgi:hypothetical protein
MRLWRAKQVHIVANRLKRAKQRQVDEEIRKLHAEATELKQHSNSLLDAAKYFQKRATELPNSVLVEQFNTTVAAEIDVCIKQIRPFRLDDRKRVSVILEAIQKKNEADISHAYEFEPSGWTGVDVGAYRPSPTIVRMWVESVFSVLHRKLSEYTFDMYQPWLFDSWETDMRDLDRLARESAYRLRECLLAHWRDVLKKLAADWQRKHLELTQLADGARSDAASLVSKSDNKKREAEALNIWLQLFVTRLERDEDNGNRFEKMLLSSYGARSKQLTQSYRSQTTPSNKLLVLLALRQLQEEKDYLFSLGGTSKDD